MIRTFVIHLARATGRRAAVDRLLEASPYPAEILPACDGAAMAEEERAALYPGPSHFEPPYPFPLAHGEIGCFVSHIWAWRKITEDGLDGALILEDDVAPDAALFERAVKFAEAHLETYGYIQFQVRSVRGEVEVLAEGDGFQLVRPRIAPRRTSAQLVSAPVARKLLALNAKIDRPVDGMLQLSWEIGFPMVCVVPSGVGDLTEETGGSTVSRGRTALAALSAEIKRLIYRNRIRRLSDRFREDQARR